MENKNCEARYKKGMNVLKQINNNAIEDLFNELEDVTAELGKFVVEFPYSEIYTREGLDLKTRELATVAALTSMGNAKSQLQNHINAALNVDNSPSEIIEVIMQMSAYAGFPASIKGIMAAKKYLKKRITSYKTKIKNN
ncbi:hypothetical protein ALNOE001_02720 [Candidatus Methanobinarius endosymbioticus]|uniref:Carboxymuconolactone decarboxylase-like domain-containing protein n=1 Tax=Candidatus Methanobinarius endosymbioticus TaxID=2006182 RepID=A0A366ME83_9EURY|nr:hypothetical protein ALNOE001_02720 [Candidatus Methanobinarius endosymbioticus]